MSGERDSARFIKRYIHKNGSLVWADVSTVLRRGVPEAPAQLLPPLRRHPAKEIAEHLLSLSTGLGPAPTGAGAPLTPRRLCGLPSYLWLTLSTAIIQPTNSWHLSP